MKLVVSFTPWPLCPQGKSPWYPLDRRLVGPITGLDLVEKRKFPAPARTQTPNHPTHSPALYHQAVLAPTI